MSNYQNSVAKLDNRRICSETTSEQLRDIDKWQAARHEAAHIVAAAVHDAVLLEADLTANGLDDVSIEEEAAWTGQTRGLMLDGIRLSGVVGAPGVTGEHLIQEPDIDGYELADIIDLDYPLCSEMSSSDAALMPDDFGEQIKAYDAALVILRANREVWDLISLELYQHEGICKDVVEALWLGIVAPSEVG